MTPALATRLAASARERFRLGPDRAHEEPTIHVHARTQRRGEVSVRGETAFLVFGYELGRADELELELLILEAGGYP